VLWVGIVAVALARVAPARAQARAKAPRLTALRCIPTQLPDCRSSVRVRIGKQVRFRGRRLSAGMRVTFRWPRGALTTRLRRSRRVGLTARVPEGTRAGRVSVTVRSRAGRRSNRRRIVVLATRYAPSGGALPVVFRGSGMWIWYLSSSEGGDIGAIATRARAAGMSTVFIKSSDGSARWSQFSPALVLGLHARGLRVCAWQFVYGAQPEAEADAGAAAVATGADCLVIDAESAYEGRYSAAQRYMARLRAQVGPNYPLGLTSFAYVGSHPRLPYSVFLAPGGAQANLPQVYWKDIGGSVDAVSARSVAHNRIYGVPMAPLGQAYNAPKTADLQRFRSLWPGYGAGGMSWWSWQSASAGTWAALSMPAPPPVAAPDPGWPALAMGSTGDQVIWLQQHLAAADPSVKIDGRFSSATSNALKAFQRAKGLPGDGETDAATWRAVLAQPLRLVRWAAR
jgi:hypothetical protein